MTKGIGKILDRDFKSLIVIEKDSTVVNDCLLNVTKFANVRSDSALYYADRSILLADKAGLIKKVSIALQKMGQYYMVKENFADAISCFINAIKIEEKLADEKRIADLSIELGSVYNYQEIFNKALEYNNRALSIYKNENDTLNIANVLGHIGSLHLAHEYCETRTPDQKKSDQKFALDFFMQSMELYKKKADLNGIAVENLNIGTVYNRMKQPEIALEYEMNALEFYRKNKNQERVSTTLYSIGFIYNQLKRYDLALQCLKEAELISFSDNFLDGIQYLFEAIAQTYKDQKDFKNALDYYQKYMTIRDSIYNKEKSRQIFELETKYQVEKKQNEIKKLIIVKQKRTYIIYILSVILFLFSLLGLSIFRNIRTKRIIAEQNLLIRENQILELEKEHQLAAARSVLLGEETERSRLASDLHDGLGGLLTGVKLKLSSMKENAVITSENLASFNHALHLLDTSISELRRVAHNLMPETLMHFGLKTALRDFIQQVDPDDLPIMRFNTFGDDLRFSKELEITIYRITQELITNSIKHSGAKQIDIQLFTEKNRVCVQVVDNGIGFEPEKLGPTHKGNGLKNIFDRATAFNGRFEIISQPGKGSESTIEFLIS